jgi:hypothetical protein
LLTLFADFDCIAQFARKGGFERLLPVAGGCKKYLPLLSVVRYSDALVGQFVDKFASGSAAAYERLQGLARGMHLSNTTPVPPSRTSGIKAKAMSEGDIVSASSSPAPKKVAAAPSSRKPKSESDLRSAMTSPDRLPVVAGMRTIKDRRSL